MSGWYPKAIKKEIRPGKTDPPIRPIGVILHVDAGNVNSLYNYFSGPSGGVESHFHVQKDGDVEQYRACGFEADANYKANSFMLEGVRRGYISVETQGLGDGKWTEAQLAAIKDLILWAHRTYGIPLEICTGPKDAGIGYHSQFKDWSPVAKSCPGPDRINQIKDVLGPWLKKMDPRTPKSAPAPSDLAAWLKAQGIPADQAAVDLSRVQLAARKDPTAKAGTFTAKHDVTIVELALKAEGLLAKDVVDGHFGSATIEAYKKWQLSAAGGNAEPRWADGVPGLTSLTKLAKRHGFKVVE